LNWHQHRSEGDEAMKGQLSVQNLATITAILCLLSAFSSPAFSCMFCETIKYPDIALTFSSDGKILASSSSTKHIKQGQNWQWQKGTTVELWHVPIMKLWKRLPEGQGSYALAFSPDGNF